VWRWSADTNNTSACDCANHRRSRNQRASGGNCRSACINRRSNDIRI
jgi:hypothetical protein